MRGITSAHTLVEAEVSPAVYDEIAAILKRAGYGHAFVDDNRSTITPIDMTGIALVRAAQSLADLGHDPYGGPEMWEDEPLDPIAVMLFCPACKAQHIDAPEGDWTNPPHRSHLCATCGAIWRPCDIATTGVQRAESRGKADTLP